jgi:hypothetical protein
MPRRTSWIGDLAFCLVSIGLTLVVAGIYVLQSPYGENFPLRGLPLDDSWIHLDYARSLAEQGGFFYNRGVPEAGMSSPLWDVILAIGLKLALPLGITPQWVAKGASLLFALPVPVATYFLTRHLVQERLWAWAAGLLVALDPNLAYDAISGMEVTLAALLILLAIWLSLRKAYLWAGLTLGALVVTRGEGVPIAILVGGVPLVVQYLRRDKSKPVLVTSKEAVMAVQLFLPALLLGAAWAVFNRSVSGNLLPNTYYVKHGFDLGIFDLPNMLALFSGYLQHLAFFHGSLAALALLAVVATVAGFVRARRYDVMALILGVPLTQLYLFSINIHLFPEGPWIFYVRRYMDFLIPLWAILLVLGVHFAWRTVREKPSPVPNALLPAATMVMMGLFGWNALSLHLRFMGEYYTDTKRVETVDVAIGRWIATNLPPDASIGITEAGATRYFAAPQQTVVDFLGLNCHECVGQPPDYIIQQLRPEYLVFFRPAIRDTFRYQELFVMNTYPDGRGSELVVLQLLY